MTGLLPSPLVSNPSFNASLIVKINIPSVNSQKSFKINQSSTIWAVNKMIAEKIAQDIKDIYNYGLFLGGINGKRGKFLDDRNTVHSYHLDSASQLDFMVKCRIGADPADPKKQKKIIEDIQKGMMDKLKEKVTSKTDLNFVCENETPLSVATMNNDSDMIVWLMDNGAILDFRCGEKDQWKTPLHLAAAHNKPNALKTLCQYGAWVEVKDALGYTPLYYATVSGNTECVLRLLLAKSDTEVVDEFGRTVLHQAVMNNYDCNVALLIDFGANMEHENVAGNSPIHVAASRNCKESTKWLLTRGAEKDKTNKAGKTAWDCGLQANCTEICEILEKFSEDLIVPPPPRYIPEDIKEIDQIVSNVLSSLSSSIGSEYKPLFFSKISARAKSMSPNRKSMIPLQKQQDKDDDTNSLYSLDSKGLNTRQSTVLRGSTVIRSPLGKQDSNSSFPLDSEIMLAGSVTIRLTPDTTTPTSTELISHSTLSEEKQIRLLKTVLAQKSGAYSEEEMADLLGAVTGIETGLIRYSKEINSLRKQNDEMAQKIVSLGQV